MKIHEAMAAVMQAVPAVPKGDRNTSQNFSFRGIDAVLNAVGPALRDQGVLILPTLVDERHQTVQVGRNQTPMNWVLLTMRYMFVGPEGDTLHVTVPGEAMDAGDKAYSKAMSVALRTALIQTFALPTDEPDPDHDVYERSPEARTMADVARDSLMEVVKEYGLTTVEVAKQYLSTYGAYLHEENDSRRIREFTVEVIRECEAGRS